MIANTSHDGKLIGVDLSLQHYVWCYFNTIIIMFNWDHVGMHLLYQRYHYFILMPYTQLTWFHKINIDIYIGV